MEGQLILARVEDYLQKANTGAPGMSEEIIEEAGERFKAVLRKTFNETRGGNFRIYMSNAGKASCQLVMERNGAPKEPLTAAFRMKMLMGDAAELILRAVMKGSGVVIDSSNVKVTLPLLPGIEIRGEYDFKIKGRIWDAKSSSRYAFDNKWSSGFHHIEQYDDFGYCAQLYGYAEADNAKVGGFIVVCKETGKLAAIDAVDTVEYRTKHLNKLKANVVQVLDTERPFTRNFSDEPETFYGKPTGNRTLGMTCGFCEFKYSCWPGLKRKEQAQSKATNKKMIYYTVWDEKNNIAPPKEVKEKPVRKSRAKNETPVSKS
jgi:hypothetical protein